MIVERLIIATGIAFNLQDLAAHCRVDTSDDDLSLYRDGQAAAAELEHYAQLALLTQTIRVTLPCWPRSCWFNLPISPLIDPLSVAITADGVAYLPFGIVQGLRPAVHLTEDRPAGLIVVTYRAGFGGSASDVPTDLRLAILDQAAAFYDLRGAGDGKTNGMSPHMARVAARYRRVAL